MMLAAIAMMADGAFSYSRQVDAMTDAALHVATVSQGREAHLSVICGSDTDMKPWIVIDPDFGIPDRKGGLLRPFVNRVRFGDLTPLEVEVQYSDDKAYIVGNDARLFAEQVQKVGRVVVELISYSEAPRQVLFQTINASESVGRVLRDCRL